MYLYYIFKTDFLRPTSLYFGLRNSAVGTISLRFLKSLFSSQKGLKGTFLRFLETLLSSWGQQGKPLRILKALLSSWEGLCDKS